MWNVPASTPGRTHTAKWGSEIELIEKLPASDKAERWQFFSRNVPIVHLGAAHPAITLRHQIAMQPKVQQQVLDQNQTRMPSRKVKPVQNIELVPLNVDRDEVNNWRTGLRKDLVQRAYGHVNATVRLHFCKIKVAVERGVAAG